MLEQRQHQRRELVTEALIANPAGAGWSPVGLLDISISGASFKTSERIIVDTVRQLNITLPNSDKPILVSAKVVNRLPHDEGFRVGIKFINVDPATINLISQYVHVQTA